MSKINIVKELSLNGYPLTKVATHKNPYLKRQNETIATVQYITETLEDFKGVGYSYNAELVRKTDTLIIDDNNKDVVFGLTVEIIDNYKFKYANNTLETATQVNFSDGSPAVYMAYYARFANGVVRTFDETSLTTGYNFEWQPEFVPNLYLSPKMKNVLINVLEATTAPYTPSILNYPSANFLGSTSLTTASDYKNLTVVVDNTYLDLPETKTSTIIPFATALQIDFGYFCDLLDFTEPLNVSSMSCKTDLTKLTKLKNVIITNITLSNMSTTEIVNNFKKVFCLTEKTVTSAVSGTTLTLTIS